MNETFEISDELNLKREKLIDYIKNLGSVVIGFSGGVDSSFLLAAAHETVGENVIAVTGADPSVPERELKEARDFCAERGIRHVICKTDPLKEEGYRQNSPDRCYFCKHGIFEELKKTAEEYHMEYIAEGSNLDDVGDYRPGMRAARELSVKSPLLEVGLHKSEIRLLSRAMGLPTWSKPAYACLASRFVYGEEITEEKLHRIDRAEQFLIERGFFEERVRIHGNMARIEVPPSDIPRLASDKIRNEVYEEFRKLGFSFVTIDMRGYRMGSMNTTLSSQ